MYGAALVGYPDQLPGPPRVAHQIPAFFRAPRAYIPRPPTMVYPDQLRGRAKRAHQYPAVATRIAPERGYLLGVGPAGAATFILSLQPGTIVTFSWRTAIYTSHSGLEQRESPFGQPKRRFAGNAFLLDGNSRDVRAAMMRSAASGATFLLALPFEALSFTNDSSGTTVYVPTTASCDWARPGQRVAVVGPSMVTITAVVQSITATTIVLDAAPGAAGRAGGLIMPLVPILLDPEQGFARYATRVDLWSLRALGSSYGFAGVDAMGTGAVLATYVGLVAVADLGVALEDGALLIWDRPNAIDGTANESMLSGAEVVDFGAVPFGDGGQLAPSWSRSIKLRSASRADWQWFKAFLRYLRGQQGAFLLPTNRPDLICHSTAPTATGITIKSASVAGSGDYVSWFASNSHRRLAIATAAGAAVQYATVTAVVDNLDGTMSLTLDTPPTGTITKVSFLDQVRFGRGDIEASWDGGMFSVDESVVSVRDPIPPGPSFMFETVLTATLTADTVASAEITLPLEDSTVLEITFDQGPPFYNPRDGLIGAITATGGNVDGMLVMIPSHATRSVILFAEQTAFAASSRIRFPSSITTWSTLGGLMLVYCGAISRWLLIGKAP